MAPDTGIISVVDANHAKFNIKVRCVGCRDVSTVAVKRLDYSDWMETRKFAQEAFPYLSASDRELLISHYCGSCFDQVFPPDQD